MNKQKTYSLTYQGKVISINTVTSKSWYQFENQKKNINWEFIALIKNNRVPKLRSFGLSISYNSRLDVDNTVYTAKQFVDCMRHCKCIADDTAKQYKKLSIEYDGALEPDTYIFNIEVLERA